MLPASISDGTRPGPVATEGASPWWAHPARFLLIIILPIAIVMSVYTDDVIDHNGADYSSPVFFNAYYAWLFLGGITAIALLAMVGARGQSSAARVSFADGALDFLFIACMAAYAIWFGPILASAPQVLMAAIMSESGAVYDVRELSTKMAGITTLTQFGVAFVCIYGIRRFVNRERLPRRFDVYLVLILCAALFRALVNSERIAFIELFIPLMLTLCRGTQLRGALPLRAFRHTLPLLILGGGPLFFALFEYNRSWINHYQYEYASLFDFALERFGLYYITSVNNLSGFLEHSAWPTLSGEWTLQWLHRFPLIGTLITSLTGANNAVLFEEFLKEYATDEFNNPTGILIAYHDWGVIGGFVFLGAYGYVAGRAYRAFDQGRGLLQYVFPVICYSFFEILRIGYMYDGRSMAAVIGLVIAYWIWGKRAEAPRPAAIEPAPQAS
jgi:oligosaccharide repeat unit polymerase